MLNHMALWNLWGAEFGWRSRAERPIEKTHTPEEEEAFARRVRAARLCHRTAAPLAAVQFPVK